MQIVSYISTIQVSHQLLFTIHRMASQQYSAVYCNVCSSSYENL